MFNKSFLFILAFWSIGFIIISHLPNNQVQRENITSKSGIFLSGECVNTRSVNGLKVVIMTNGKNEELYLSLPFEVECDQPYVTQFIDQSVDISFYKGTSLGLEINGNVIKDLEEEILKYNDKSVTKSFLLFLLTIFCFFFYFFLRKNVSVR